MPGKIELQQAVDIVSSFIQDPRKGLPQEVFLFASGITPMVNVDLLIRNDKEQTLLTWRDDGYYEPGWHVPGGIIRFKERIEARLMAVAMTELGAEIDFLPVPLAMNELIHPKRNTRGHFISLLYECVLTSGPEPRLACLTGSPQAGQWMWHDKCPDDIISVHEIYRPYMGPRH